jgi:hypothetical protein
MFAPLVSKARAEAAAGPANKLALHGSTRDARSQSDSGRKSARGGSWDFSKISLFPPDRTNRDQTSSRLTIPQVNDPLEHQADRIADQVTRDEEVLKMRPATASSPEAVDREAPDIVHEVLRSPGLPLDAGTRAFFEPRFHTDLSAVRIHTDAAAAQSARTVNAHAYAVGHDIVFASQRFAPTAPAGRRLLAHELAHVWQQRNGAGSPARAVQRQAATEPEKLPVGTASSDEVAAALTDFFVKVQAAQGGQALRITEPVRQALRILVQDANARLRIDAFLERKDLGGSPAAFAREAVKHLPQGIPRSRLEGLNKIPPLETPDTRPKSIGEAVAGLVDVTIVPLVKALKLPTEVQATIVKASRSAVVAGTRGILEAALANAQIDSASKTAILAAWDQAVRQKTGAKPAGGGKEAPDTHYPQQPAPSVAPSVPSAPGESVTKGPDIDIPVPAAPKAPTPSPPASPSLEQVIRGLDKDALVPPEARGKPAAAVFVQAQDFAASAATQLDAAQKAKKKTPVELTISAAYRSAQNVPAILDEAARIVQQVANALPHHASEVSQVIVQIASDDAKEPSHLRRIIRLHELTR